MKKIVYILILATLAILTTNVGCKEKLGHTTIHYTNPPQKDTQSLKELFFKLKLDEYYSLQYLTDKTITIDIIISTISNSGHPVPLYSYNTFMSLFDDHFKFTVNKNIKKYSFEIPWNTFKVFAGFDYFDSTTNPDTGFALYYLVNNNDTGNMYFTYVISKAMIDTTLSDSIRPINPLMVGGIDYYLMLTPNEPYHQLITKSEFVKYYKAYKNLTSNILNNIIYDIDTMEHPRICYHSGKNLFYLFHDNRGPLIANNLSVVFTHGARGKINIPVSNGAITAGDLHGLYLQSPLLVLKYNGSKLIDDSSYRDQYSFKQRALDVGRLCPPQCN